MVKIVVMKGDYELQRARSIRLNKEFLHSQQMVCSGYKISSFNFISNNRKCHGLPVLVAKKWWSRSHATKPSLISVVPAIDDAAFPRPKKNCTLREMIAHGWKPAS